MLKTRKYMTAFDSNKYIVQALYDQNMHMIQWNIVPVIKYPFTTLVITLDISNKTCTGHEEIITLDGKTTRYFSHKDAEEVISLLNIDARSDIEKLSE